MYNLIIYDTSNFEDFPIGGQLTSIRCFLKYIANAQKDRAGKILLVGITADLEAVGKYCFVEIDGCRFSFLPVLYRERNLSDVQGSLRLAYLKALFRHHRKIPASKNTVHYIHTPEAYIAVKVLHPAGKTAVFSHGSFFNMVEGFRFFQKNKLIHVLFERFVVFLLRTADLVFTLDEPSTTQYIKYTKKICRAENSIVIPMEEPQRNACHTPVRLLFVGRLSKVKQIEGIIEAVALSKTEVNLTIIGDGEECTALRKLVEEKALTCSIKLEGYIPPAQVGEYMQSHDILVMNSILEGKPMTILEAMSFGLPVITTPVGGIPEMVTQGQSAEFTDGTAEDILRKINVVKENYAHYSQQARDRSERYDYRYVNVSIWRKISEI